jgi:dGTP triphosphohydrolase
VSPIVEKTRALLVGRDVRLTGGSTCERILRVADYVSGMTDRHTLATFRRLTGITIPPVCQGVVA